MRKSLGAIIGEIDGFRFRRGIEHALALNRRGEVRTDALKLTSITSRMEVEWFARDIHPWDRDRGLSREDKSLMFVQQCLSDTEAAVSRLFERFRHVDTIEVRVLEPKSAMSILAGTVSRESIERNESLSVGMRLMLSGITFRLSNWQFDPLDVADEKIAEALESVTAA